jgi:NAD-dependent dihydropyrimidine dehydrogenase PreA subunit
VRSHGTGHIQVDTRRCEACRGCVEACRDEVLGMISLFFHKHVVVRHPDRCRGCLRCVRACEHGAILALHPRQRSDRGAPSSPPDRTTA